MAEPGDLNEPFDSFFEPYAREIGFLLRDWNDLQEKLADLFGTLISPSDSGVARAIWYAIPSDRLQRAMLYAAAAYLFHTDSIDHRTFRAEIAWIVERANSLGAQRDAAAHAPVGLLLGEPYEFIARHFHGNPLAKRLQGKRLLDEFKLYRRRAIVLRDHADVMDQYFEHGIGRWTWPKRPEWPSSPQSRAAKSRADRPKARSPQRQSRPRQDRSRSKKK